MLTSAEITQPPPAADEMTVPCTRPAPAKAAAETSVWVMAVPMDTPNCLLVEPLEMFICGTEAAIWLRLVTVATVVTVGSVPPATDTGVAPCCDCGLMVETPTVWGV